MTTWDIANADPVGDVLEVNERTLNQTGLECEATQGEMELAAYAWARELMAQ